VHTIKLRVNGYLRELAVKPHQTLLDVLRGPLELTGAKEGCGREAGELLSCSRP